MQIHWLYEHSEHWIGFTILDPCSAFHLDTDWTTRQVQPNSCRLLLLPLSKALNRKKTAQNVHCFFKAKFQKRHFILHQLEVLEVSQLQLKGGGFTLTGWADGAARCYYTGGAVKTKPVTCLSMRLSAGSASPTWQQDWDLRCSAFSGAALFQNRRDGWHGSRGPRAYQKSTISVPRLVRAPLIPTLRQRPSPSEGNQRCRENQRFLCNCPTAAGFHCSPQWRPAETVSTLWFHVTLQSRGGWWCDETLNLNPHSEHWLGTESSQPTHTQPLWLFLTSADGD